MNTTGRKAYQPPSGWDVEVERFKILADRWLDYRLNNFFDLTIRGPGFRRYWTMALAAGFVAGGFIVHALLYYLPVLAPARALAASDLVIFFVLTIARLVIILLIPGLYCRYDGRQLCGGYLRAERSCSRLGFHR